MTIHYNEEAGVLIIGEVRFERVICTDRILGKDRDSEQTWDIYEILFDCDYERAEPVIEWLKNTPHGEVSDKIGLYKETNKPVAVGSRFRKSDDWFVWENKIVIVRNYAYDI